MDARRATAAVSAAGIILIAGCGSGGKMGGASLPNGGSQSGLHQNKQPANSSRVGMTFAIPRTTKTWASPVRTAYKVRRSKAFTPTKPHRSMLSGLRKPQFISEGLIGGSISIFIYQGANLALTQGPFTAGTTYGAYDFYCAYNPVAAEVLCTNYTPVFAPYGTDSFYVAMYDSANHLLSITPGMPGTNFVSATQPTYTITSSGYASPISIQTYAVAAYLGIDAPTSCLDPSDPNEASGFLLDGAGYPISGPVANPVTLSTTGNFSFYNLYGQFATPYTIYNAYGGNSAFAFEAPGSGTAGSVSVSSTGGSVGINLTSNTTMSLYTVDRLAVTPSTSGISLIGLVDSSASTYACGKIAMGNYVTGAPITSFSNPVAIGEDDYIPGVGVLDSVSGSPYLSLVDLNREDYGLFLIDQQIGGIVNEVPVAQVAVAGHNPLALAVSPSEDGSGIIYILNADGSIQTVNDYNNFGATATLEPTGTIPGPVDISVNWGEFLNFNGEYNGDYVFATSSNSANLFEISDANSSPNFTTDNLTGVAGLVTPTTYAISSDNIDESGYLSFIAFDSGNGGAISLFTCMLPSCDFAGDTVFSYSAPLGQGRLTFNFTNSSILSLVANANDVSAFEVGPGNPEATPAPFPAFGAPVTQAMTTYDGLWNGFATGGLIQFFYNLSGTVAGSLTGTRATIVSPFYPCDC